MTSDCNVVTYQPQNYFGGCYLRFWVCLIFAVLMFVVGLSASDHVLRFVPKVTTVLSQK